MTLSVVICSYNPNPDWLRAAISSCLGVADQIVVVNNGSKSFPTLSHSPTLSLTHLPANIGWAKGVNRGVDEAAGDFICNLDDDDELIPENALALKQHLASLPPCDLPDVMSFPITILDSSLTPRTSHLIPWQHERTWGTELNPALIYRSNHVPGMSWFKKTVWSEQGGFRLDVAGDWEFWTRLHSAGAYFDFYDLPIARHRQRPGSFSTTWTHQQMLNTAKAVAENAIVSKLGPVEFQTSPI